MAFSNFTRGGKVTSIELNQLADMIRANSVTSVIGGTFSRTPGGTAIFIDQQVRGSGGGELAPCPFRLTDASENSILKVEVAITTVQTTTGARYPQGMSLGGPAFKLTLANTSYIYCKLQYVTNDVILDSAENAITVLQSETILPNEVNAEYVLLGTVIVSGSDPNKTISEINSVCLPVSPNPCNLQWA